MGHVGVGLWLWLWLCVASAWGLSVPKRRCHFINLTNGIEALQHLDRQDVSFVRIQSSRCEANDFYGILSDIDHNLLFQLAIGSECVVYDYGSRGTAWPGADGEMKVPRAIWWGVEWVRYALRRTWKIEETDAPPPTLRGYNVKSLFDEKLNRLPKPLYKKLKYYRKFHPEGVDLVGAYGTKGTTFDGKDDVYERMVLDWRATLEGADAAVADALPDGFRVYRADDYAGVGRGACRAKRAGDS